MLDPDAIIRYDVMCKEEGGARLQRGMYFRLHGRTSLVLMNRRPDAPYADRIEDDGRTLVYEGHDVNRDTGIDPKKIDQPMTNASGSLTLNGCFYEAVKGFKAGEAPEIVKVYEKLQPGTWTYNGLFRLVDAWKENNNARQVFKFKLEVTDGPLDQNGELGQVRLIPTSIKLEVWRRDKGRCVMCGATDKLRFNHALSFSRDKPVTIENIRIVCTRHDREKQA